MTFFQLLSTSTIDISGIIGHTLHYSYKSLEFNHLSQELVFFIVLNLHNRKNEKCKVIKFSPHQIRDGYNFAVNDCKYSWSLSMSLREYLTSTILKITLQTKKEP